MRARWWSALRLVSGLALVVAGCSAADEPAPTTAPTTSTTRIILDLEPATDAQIELAEGVDAGRSDELREWISGLRAAAELVRGLRFLDEPQILVMSADAYQAEWLRQYETTLDPTALAVDTRFLQLIGVLQAGQSLRVMITPVFESPPAAFYDGDLGMIVLAAPAATPSLATDRDVVSAIVVALTDQYHQHVARHSELVIDGLLDEADALAGLVAADASYFGLVYLQEVAPDDLPTVAAAAPGPRTPGPIGATLAFPYEEAFAFVSAVIAEGGIASLDELYSAERLTTEDVMHPERRLAPDPQPEVGPSPLALTGYRLHRTGTLGELGLRSIIGHAQAPSIVRQATDGWAADHFAMFSSGNDSAFVYLYQGDNVDDAVEVAQAFLDLAAGSMGLAEPVVAGGGVEFIGPAEVDAGEETVVGPYVFVDRVGDGLQVVIADQISAGRELVASTAAP